MGNSLSNSNDYEVEDNNSKESESHEKKTRIKGTDYTYDVSEMLKQTDKKIVYDSEKLPTTKEDLPVPGAFLVHNLLTEEECKQFISLAESMVFAPSPLRNLDSVNSNTATLDSYTQSIRNSESIIRCIGRYRHYLEQTSSSVSS